MIKFAKILLLTLVVLILSCSKQKNTEEYLQSGQKMLADREWKGAIIEFKNAAQQSPDNAKARALLGESYLHTYSSNAAIKELKLALELGYSDSSALVNLGKGYQQKNEYQAILQELQVNDSQPSGIKANIHALRADAYLALNKLDQAKIELDLALSLDESSSDVRLAWATYEKRAGNIEAQKKWLKPLIESGDEVSDAWSQMAEIEQNAANLDAAEAAYSRAIELHGIVHLDLLKRALLRITKTDYEGAMGDINTLKKAGAQWPMIGYAEGLIAYQQKNYNASQTLFENVLSLYPDYLPARLLVGLTHYNKANFQNAVTNLEIFLAASPDSMQAKIIYAASLLKLGKASQAIPILLELNKIVPESQEVLSLLASAYLTNKQQDKSIQILTKAVQLKPTQAKTRLQLGSLLLREENGIETAQKQLIKAIELDPDLFQADIALFLSYIRSKDYLQSRAIAQQLKTKKKDTAIGANLIALSYLAEGNKPKAITELQETLLLFPADPVTSDNLARIYFQENQLDEAKALYVAVLKARPDDLKSLNQLALIAAREGNREKVIDWLKLAAERNPEVLSAKLLLALQYIDKNEIRPALDLLQNVKEGEKEDPNYILLIAKTKMSVGEYQHATRILKSLIAKKPDFSSAHFFLAQSYAHQNDNKNMRESLENTLKLTPEHFSANLALTRLDLFENKIESFKKRVELLVLAYPDNKEVQLLNAKVQSSSKNYDSAIKTLSSLMNGEPSSEVIIDLSKNQWNSGDKESAISGLTLWLQNNKEDKNALMLLAQFYLAESRTSEAKNTYEALDKQIPNNPVVLNNLAWLMMDSDVTQGIIYAQKALNLDPGDAYIEDTLAMLLLKNGDKAKALLHSENAASKLTNIVDIQLNYAKALSANNQTAKAKGILNNLLSHTKDYDKRKAITKELNALK